MTFGVLGGFIEGASDLTGGAIGLIHRTTDDTLDRTGLSAFIPPALHEVSDGTLGLLQRGVLDVGHTTGSVLKSFDQRPLHAHDKEIGGNIRKPPGSQTKGNHHDKGNNHGHSHSRDSHSRDSHSHSHSHSRSRSRSRSHSRDRDVPMCKWCKQEPRASNFDFCSMQCMSSAKSRGQSQRFTECRHCHASVDPRKHTMAECEAKQRRRSVVISIVSHPSVVEPQIIYRKASTDLRLRSQQEGISSGLHNRPDKRRVGSQVSEATSLNVLGFIT
ncbi:hypothetical protein BXZ70DRAFT_910012 [Cristinia sonorae]|uniref:Uncharacterized protein n=1 Tax=Cristinia sonorae TaxID=1940300 RepID=A0A8K0XLH4_9AGAR|nr:hypothetical protein BXZ70DRAFT_910012 [Cristinia sonorae]